MNNLVLKDTPLQNIKDETLGLASYADYLGDFIRDYAAKVAA